MNNCHDDKSRQCNYQCEAYSGEELPYGSGKKGHCLKLAGPYVLAKSIDNHAEKIETFRYSVDALERALHNVVVEVYT